MWRHQNKSCGEHLQDLQTLSPASHAQEMYSDIPWTRWSAGLLAVQRSQIPVSSHSQETSDKRMLLFMKFKENHIFSCLMSHLRRVTCWEQQGFFSSKVGFTLKALLLKPRISEVRSTVPVCCKEHLSVLSGFSLASIELGQEKQKNQSCKSNESSNNALNSAVNLCGFPHVMLLMLFPTLFMVFIISDHLRWLIRCDLELPINWVWKACMP